MTPEALRAQFDVIAEAPNGVEKLRELVLRLAFQGRLLHEPSTRASDGLPNGWAWRTVGDMATAIDSGFACNKQNEVANGYVHLRTHNVGTDGRLNFDLVIRITPDKVHPERARLQAGDVLFNNTNSQELVGKTCLVDRDYEYGFSNHLTRVRVSDAVAPGYLVRYCNLLLRTGYFASYCNRWIGQAGINSKMLREVTIPVAPIAEQRRIVAKVDELMALCDELEARQQRRAEARVRANRSVLHHLVEASGDEALAAGWERLRENFGLLYDAPEAVAELRTATLRLVLRGRPTGSGYAQRSSDGTVGDYVRFQNGYAFKSEWFVTEGVALLRNVNVGHGEIDWRQRAALPVDRAPEFERFVLREGDIVLSLDRPLISSGLKAARVRAADLPALLLQRVARAQVDEDRVDPRYFFFWLCSPEFTGAIDPGRSNGVPHISTRQVEQVPFMPPPIDEQRRLVEDAGRLMAMCDDLDARLARARDHSADLAASVVHRLTAA